MRVWLDDEREMPAMFDTHVRTSEGAIDLIETGEVTHISLDWCLGDAVPSDKWGDSVAKRIAELAKSGKIGPIRCYVHSLSQDANRMMLGFIREAYKSWNVREKLGSES